MQASKFLAIMSFVVLTLIFLPGFLLAAERGVISKEEIFPGYCHMRFPAMVESSVGTTHMLQEPTTTDIVDFYGPCDYDPRGAEEISAQKSDRQLEYEGE
ncbi:MAG: hypothetical protein GTO40_02740, partial [Deltaproteobacteria bacterium]|nr:hypothetical protein [Deltaproteobacteria bacterium]